VRRQKAKLGPDDPDTLASMTNLAMVYMQVDRLDLALQLLEEALTRKKAVLGPDHPSTLRSMNNLAAAYRRAGRLDDALPLFEKTLELRKTTLGPDHPETLRSMGNLAATFWSMKRLDKSIPLFELVLERWDAIVGPDHPDTIMDVANLGVNYKAAGRLEEALPLLERAYRAEKHPGKRQWMGAALLDGYVQAGKTEQAVVLAGELLAKARERSPEGGPRLAGELARLASSMRSVGAFSEAARLLRECLTIRQKAQPDSWLTCDTKSMLGEALVGQKKYADAEPLLLAGYEGMKTREETAPPQGEVRLSEALERLVTLYESRGADGDAERAEMYRTLLQERRRRGQDR
jgi:tetratricopeptide (TPR) repeat protein